MTAANGPVPSESAVREALERVLCSEGFAKREKLAAFLRYVVETALSGESDKLKQHTIAVDALGYDAGEQSETAVRAHALRLRKELERYYTGTGASDPVRIELPKGRYVPQFRFREDPSKVEKSRPAEWSWARGAVAVVFVAALVLAALVVGRVRGPDLAMVEQLTSAEADQVGPVGSLDGKWLLYSSDEEQPGGRDIWVVSLTDRTNKRRLTSHPADDYDPDISSDSRWVVFRSMRDGGGVYLVPAEGGEARRLSGGFRPRFAPNGRQIAYSVVGEMGNSDVWVQTLDGPAQRVSSGLVNARCPVWSPDSRMLLVQGVANPSDSGVREDWWVIKAEGGGPPRRVHATKALPHVATHPGEGGCPDDWIEDRVLNANGALREVRLSPRLEVLRDAEILHPGPGVSRARYQRAYAEQTFVLFEVRKTALDIYGSERTKGIIENAHWQRWTNDATLAHLSQAARVSLSKDGNRFAHLSNRSGTWAVWVKDRSSGWYKSVTTGAGRLGQPSLNSAGTRVAYWTENEGSGSIQITEVSTKATRIVCRNCGQLRSWSADDRRMLAVQGHSLIEIDAELGEQREILSDPSLEPQFAAYSPDGHWIALTTGMKGNVKMQGFVIPSQGGDRRDWHWITEEPYDLALHWTPEGDALLFFGRRDDYRCLWRQPLDRTTKRALGTPTPVSHFHGSIRVWGLGWIAISDSNIGVNATRGTSHLFRLRR